MVKKLMLILLALFSLSGLSFIFAQTGDQISGDTSNQITETDEDLSGLDNLDLDNLDDLDEENLQEDTGQENDLDDISNWGYKDTDEIVVKEVGPDYAIIEAPVVVLSDGTKIKQYKVYYSTKSLANNLDATQVMSKTFTFDTLTGDRIDLRLDGLAPNTTYYAVVVPVNSDDVEGEPSKEINFTTSRIQDEHPAPEVKIENVTYEISGDKIIIKWTPVKGADKIEIYSKSINDPDYKKVDTVNANTTSYTIQVAKPGEYQVKLTPVDEEGVPVGKDYIVTVKVAKIEKKEIKKAPKVGPETTVLFLMLLVASLGYVLIRFKRA